jgi:hypothetical protein
MVLRWSTSKIVFSDPDLGSKWPSSADICFKLADWFQKRRLLNNFPIGSYVKTMSADDGHFEPRSGSLNTILEVDHFKNLLL